MAFRVAAMRAGVAVAWTDTAMIPWPAEGVVDVVVDLPAACIPLACDSGALPDDGNAGQHCLGGAGCEPCPLGEAFEGACHAGVDCGLAGCLEA